MEKKRKILLIVLAIVAAIAIIAIPLSNENGEHGNKLEMTCLNDPKTHFNTFKPRVIITLENSYSMRGFIDNKSIAGMENVNFKSVLKNIITDTDSKEYTVQWKCGPSKKGRTYEDFDKNIRTEIFNNPNSCLHDNIKIVGNGANDSTITMFVSDMVFSLNDGKSIKGEVSDEANNLRNSLKQLKKNKIHLLLVKYLTDFNGKWYYDNTNRTPYVNCVMQKRPFYIMVFGTEENLSSLIDAKVLPAYEKLWASFSLNEADVAKKQEVKTETDSHWRNYDPEAQEGSPFTFWTETDWEDQESMVKLSFAQLASRAFLNPEWNPHCTSPAVNVFKNSNTEIEVHIKPYNQLQTIEDIKISLISDRFDWKACSIENDILSKDEISQLEGKTWAFDKFMDALAEVYPTIIKPEIVGSIEFKLMKY